MTSLLPNTSDVPVKVPDDIVIKTCFGRPEYFIKGTEVNACSQTATPSATVNFIR
jgi:hypothetical protein